MIFIREPNCFYCTEIQAFWTVFAFAGQDDAGRSACQNGL